VFYIISRDVRRDAVWTEDSDLELVIGFLQTSNHNCHFLGVKGDGWALMVRWCMCATLSAEGEDIACVFRIL